ncbi:unnamed protein product, partial [Prorocentrum cordatum]
ESPRAVRRSVAESSRICFCCNLANVAAYAQVHHHFKYEDSPGEFRSGSPLCSFCLPVWQDGDAQRRPVCSTSSAMYNLMPRFAARSASWPDASFAQFAWPLRHAVCVFFCWCRRGVVRQPRRLAAVPPPAAAAAGSSDRLERAALPLMKKKQQAAA